jgi:enoyl-CoA hydratase/carnithine racemase
MTEITTRREGSVLEIALERPARKNALTGAMYAAMEQAFGEGERDEGVAAFLLRGSDTVFTAGNDIEDFLQRPPQGESVPVFDFLQRVAALTKPLVASVNGPAIGLGTTVLLHCDLVFAGEGARFQMPFVRLGLVPEFASSYLLPLTAGRGRASEWLLTGDAFDARAAHAAGLVTRVLPDAEVLPAARKAAAQLAALPAESVRTTKALLRAPHREAIARQLHDEREIFQRMLERPAARAALAAFLAKRDTSRDKS